jgi:TetR/AcrR family transcriptional regulator
MKPALSHIAPARAESVARILAAAERLFSESGFEAVSMNNIASAAGVSKANIFHHFASKQALYIEVVRGACRDSFDRLQNLDADDGPFVQRLGVFAAGMLRNMLEHDQVHRLILRELLTHGEERGRELAEQVFGDNFARLVSILRAGQIRGELRADLDPAMAATLLIGANVFFFEAQQVLRHFRDVDFAHEPARYSQMLADILLRGILAHPDKTNPPGN